MAIFDINKIKIKFMVKYPRFKYILNELPIELDYKVETACTDGEKLYFNPTFMENLDEDQQLFVFAHEVLHVALNHIDRCLDKNPYYWNLATDAVINDYLKNNGLKFVDGCVDVAGALNHTAEEMYEKLKKEDEDKKEDEPKNINDSDKRGNGKPSNSTSNSDNNSNDKNDENKSSTGENQGNDKDEKVGHDSHGMWKKTAEKHKREGKENKDKINENAEFNDNDAEKKKNDDNYLANGINPSDNGIPGKNIGNGRKKPFKITEEPEIFDWRRLLLQNTKQNPDWDTRNGEIENGVVVSTFIEDEFSSCEIVIDTSASISEDLIRNFLKECLSIIQSSNTKVGFFDTKFYGFNDVRDEDDINNLNINGGGGTDFNAAIEAFSENCDNRIIFTDGLSKMPDKEIDAIWIVFGNYHREIHPKGGKVIYITGEDYKKLCERSKARSR